MSRRQLDFAPLRVLLVQCRLPGSPVLEHEKRCVEAKLRTSNVVVTSVNVLERRLVDHLAVFPEVDALILGGSGEFSVPRTPAKWLDDYMEDLRQVMMKDLPIFGICFGLQVLVAAMGGDVVHDAPNAESGVRKITLTAEGRRDPVFGCLPAQHQVLTEHQDRVERLPVGVEVLTRGDDVAVQAIRISGRPIYAVQYHPELDAAAMRQRQLFYRETFACMFEGAGACGDVEHDGVEVSRLLRYFAETVRRGFVAEEELPLVA